SRAEQLDVINKRWTNVLVERTGRSRSTIRRWMLKEKWFDAQEAVTAGLADEIAPEAKMPIVTIPPNTEQKPAGDEVPFFDLLNAVGFLRVNDKKKFGRELEVWFARKVQEL